jgi:DNA-binding transcriptional LysR family regulator
VLLAAAIEGAGIALQPAYSASGPIAQGRLVTLLPGFVPQGLGVYGLYGSRRRMPASLRVLLDLLVARFADGHYWPPAPLTLPDRPRGRARARNPTA